MDEGLAGPANDLPTQTLASGSSDPDLHGHFSDGGDDDLLSLPHLPLHPFIPIPPGCRPYSEPIQLHSLGSMTVSCLHCHALHFKDAKT